MRIFRRFTGLLLFLVYVSSASSGEEVFTGCYSLDQEGEPWLKIEDIEENIYLSVKNRDGWQEGASLHPATQQELAELFEKDSSRIKAGLVADDGPFALFHVKAGETYGGYKAGTDYIAYILIGAGSAYKKDCLNK